MTYPNPADPVSALSRADGSTGAHSADHGRVIEQWVNAKAHGAYGDNSHDDTVALQAGIDATPDGGTFFLPKSIYKTTGVLNVIGRRIKMIGAGPGTLINQTNAAGTDVLLVAPTNPATEFLHGLYFGNFRVKNAGTGHGVHLKSVHRSVFSNIMVLGAPSGAGWYMEGACINHFDTISATTNDSYPVTAGTFQYGLVMTQNTANAKCTDNTFTNPVFEGMTTSPGVGIELIYAEGNYFGGGTSEGNTIGLRFNGSATSTRDNTWSFIWFESNGTNISGMTGNNLRNNISYNGYGGALTRWEGTLYNQVYNPILFSSALDTEIARLFSNADSTPEGTYSAGTGSIYIGPDAPYVKLSGSGNTGWRAIESRRGFGDLSAASSPYAIDALTASHFAIIRSGAGAYTISNPTNYLRARTISFTIYNTSGGVITGTWSSDYKLAGAWTDPSTGKTRTITFVADPAISTSSWIELSRAAADIS